MTAETGFLKCGAITCVSCRLSAAIAPVRFAAGFRVSMAMAEFGRSRTQLDFTGHDPKGPPR
jgi:hypothetical protein